MSWFFPKVLGKVREGSSGLPKKRRVKVAWFISFEVVIFVKSKSWRATKITWKKDLFAEKDPNQIVLFLLKLFKCILILLFQRGARVFLNQKKVQLKCQNGMGESLFKKFHCFIGVEGVFPRWLGREKLEPTPGNSADDRFGMVTKKQRDPKSNGESWPPKRGQNRSWLESPRYASLYS